MLAGGEQAQPGRRRRVLVNPVMAGTADRPAVPRVKDVAASGTSHDLVNVDRVQVAAVPVIHRDDERPSLTAWMGGEEAGDERSPRTVQRFTLLRHRAEPCLPFRWSTSLEWSAAFDRGAFHERRAVILLNSLSFGCRPARRHSAS